jgi:divalent metal cation (Fe/Co/Zn/Cd) transporter
MIGVLLVAIAAILAVEMKSLLVGEGALREHRRAIEQALPGDGVESVIHMRTLHLGPDELLVAAKVAVAAGATGEQVATAIDAAERRVRAAVPLECVIYLEPDLRRAAAARGAQDAAATAVPPVDPR